VHIPRCRHTNVTIPECSCYACAQRLMARYLRRPPAPEVDGLSGTEAVSLPAGAAPGPPPGPSHSELPDGLRDASARMLS